jgi:hypothetical protein
LQGAKRDLVVADERRDTTSLKDCREDWAACAASSVRACALSKNAVVKMPSSSEETARRLAIDTCALVFAGERGAQKKMKAKLDEKSVNTADKGTAASPVRVQASTKSAHPSAGYRIAMSLPAEVIRVEDVLLGAAGYGRVAAENDLLAADVLDAATSKNETIHFRLVRRNNYTISVSIFNTIRLLPVYSDIIRSDDKNDNTFVREQLPKSEARQILSQCRSPIPFAYRVGGKNPKDPLSVTSLDLDTQVAVYGEATKIDCKQGSLADRLRKGCPQSHGRRIIRSQSSSKDPAAPSTCCCADAKAAAKNMKWEGTRKNRFRTIDATCEALSETVDTHIGYCYVGFAKADCVDAQSDVASCRLKNPLSFKKNCQKHIDRDEQCDKVWENDKDGGSHFCGGDCKINLMTRLPLSASFNDKDEWKQPLVDSDKNIDLDGDGKPDYPDSPITKPPFSMITGMRSETFANQGSLCEALHQRPSQLYDVEYSVFAPSGEQLGETRRETFKVGENLAAIGNQGHLDQFLKSETLIGQFLQVAHDTRVDVHREMFAYHPSGNAQRDKTCLRHWDDTGVIQLDKEPPNFETRNTAKWRSYVEINHDGASCLQNNAWRRSFRPVRTRPCQAYQRVQELHYLSSGCHNATSDECVTEWKNERQSLDNPENFLHAPRQFRVYDTRGSRLRVGIAASQSVLTGIYSRMSLKLDRIRVEYVRKADCMSAELRLTMKEVELDATTCEGTFGIRLLADGDDRTPVLQSQLVIKFCGPPRRLVLRYDITPLSAAEIAAVPRDGKGKGDGDANVSSHHADLASMPLESRCKELSERLAPFRVELQDGLQPLLFTPKHELPDELIVVETPDDTDVFNLKWDMNAIGVNGAFLEYAFFITVFSLVAIVIANAFANRGRNDRESPRNIGHRMCWLITDLLACRKCRRCGAAQGDEKSMSRVRAKQEIAAQMDRAAAAKQRGRSSRADLARAEAVASYAEASAKPVPEKAKSDYSHKAVPMAWAVGLAHLVRGLILSFVVMAYLWRHLNSADIAMLKEFPTFLEETKVAQIAWLKDIKSFEVGELKRQHAAVRRQKQMCESVVDGLTSKTIAMQADVLAKHTRHMSRCDMSDLADARDHLTLSLADGKVQGYCAEVASWQNKVRNAWIVVRAFNRFSNGWNSYCGSGCRSFVNKGSLGFIELRKLKTFPSQPPTFPDVCSNAINVLKRPQLTDSQKDSYKEKGIKLLTAPMDLVRGVLVESAFIDVDAPTSSELRLSLAWVSSLFSPVVFVFTFLDASWFLLKIFVGIAAVRSVLNGVEITVSAKSRVLRTFPIYAARTNTNAAPSHTGRLLHTVEVIDAPPPPRLAALEGRWKRCQRRRRMAMRHSTYGCGRFTRILTFFSFAFLLSFIPPFINDFVTLRNVDRMALLDWWLQPISSAATRSNDIAQQQAYLINRYQKKDMKKGAHRRLEWWSLGVQSFNEAHAKTLNTFNTAVDSYLAFAAVSDTISTVGCKKIKWRGLTIPAPRIGNGDLCTPRDVAANSYAAFDLFVERDKLRMRMQEFIYALRRIMVRTVVFIIWLLVYLGFECIVKMLTVILLRRWGILHTRVVLTVAAADGEYAVYDDDRNDFSEKTVSHTGGVTFVPKSREPSYGGEQSYRSSKGEMSLSNLDKTTHNSSSASKQSNGRPAHAGESQQQGTPRGGKKKKVRRHDRATSDIELGPVPSHRR